MNNYKVQFKCYKFFLKYLWENQKSYFVWQIINFLVSTFGAFINIIGMKYLIDEISAKDKRNLPVVIFWVCFICVGNFLYDNISKMSSENMGRINENLIRKLHTKLSLCCLDMKFENTENSEVLDIIKKAEKALNETNGINGIMTNITNIVSCTFIALGVVVIVCTRVPLLLIPVVISFVANTIATDKGNKIKGSKFEKQAEIERGSDYFNTELQDTRYAKDIRLYNTGNIFTDKLQELGEKYYLASKAPDMKMFRMNIVLSFVVRTSNMFMFLLLGFNALNKIITIGELSSLYQATEKFSGSLRGIMGSYGALSYNASKLIYYVEFVESTSGKIEKCNKIKKQQNDDIVMTRRDDISESNKGLEIEFRNVSFKYPNTKKYILKNISTKIKEGEHLSIVGQNGAGKTTFIKLLCRMYNDYEGEILVDGKNIKEYSFKEYMKKLSVVFQDFKLFAFTIRENVTVFEDELSSAGVTGSNENKLITASSNDAKTSDESSIDKKQNKNDKDSEIYKIYETVGLDDWINELPDRDDTYLYKYFVESGVEPSGGQGQKLAIARAVYRNAPIVVLDEPTAALDPLSEYEVYNNFDKLVNNKTAVYISHRLSSCRFCDRIIVFDDGKIIEEGTHDSLMAIKDGFYALMYNTQAKQYNKIRAK